MSFLPSLRSINAKELALFPATTTQLPKSSKEAAHPLLKSVRVCAFAFLTLLCLIGCQDTGTPSKKLSADSARPEQLYRIGLGPWIGFGPFYLAQQKGFFKEEGIKVELTTITGLAERNSALRANQIQGLAAPVDYFVLSAGNGLPMQIVMVVDESTGGDGMVAKKNIKSIKSLKGKRIGFQRGLPSEFFTRALLRENGMTLNDLVFTDLETAEAGAAFIAGRLDAATVWEPWLSKAAEEGKGYVLASTKEHPNLIVDCLAFTPETVEKSPQDVAKIVRALFKAMNYWKMHPQEANDIMAPNFQVDSKKYAAMLSGASFCDLPRNEAFFGSDSARGSIYKTAETASVLWKASGVIKDSVTASAIVNNQFIK